MCIRDSLYPVQEHNYMASESASGTPRNELLLQYIQELGYDVDFKTCLLYTSRCV